jgi:hypothetical protein
LSKVCSKFSGQGPVKNFHAGSNCFPGCPHDERKITSPTVHSDVFNFLQPESAQNFLIKVHLKNFKQGLIDLDHFFKRDRDRAEKISGRVYLKFFEQSLPKNSMSGASSI